MELVSLMATLLFVDLRPTESVERAQEASSQGHAEAWAALDRHLRWHLVNHLQNRSGDEEELGEALLRASHWAEREEREAWRIQWTYLLELLRDASRQPALAAELRAVGPEGRAAEVLKILASHSQPLRPSDLAKRTGLSIQQISNLGRKLESSGLIVRRPGEGKATWLFPTDRGSKLAGLLPASITSTQKLDEDETAAETPFWTGLDRPVQKIA